MKKVLRVTLDIEVEDLPDAERNRLAALACQPVEELTGLADEDAAGLAELLDFITTQGGNEMCFEGTDTIVQFTNVTVVSANFKP